MKAVVYMGTDEKKWPRVMRWRDEHPECKSVIIYDWYVYSMGAIMNMEFLMKILDIKSFDMDFIKNVYLKTIFESLPEDEMYKTYDKDGVVFLYDEEPPIKPKKASWMVI